MWLFGCGGAAVSRAHTRQAVYCKHAARVREHESLPRCERSCFCEELPSSCDESTPLICAPRREKGTWRGCSPPDSWPRTPTFIIRRTDGRAWGVGCLLLSHEPVNSISHWGWTSPVRFGRRDVAATSRLAVQPSKQTNEKKNVT